MAKSKPHFNEFRYKCVGALAGKPHPMDEVCVFLKESDMKPAGRRGPMM